MATTQSLPDGLTLGQAIRKRFERLEARMTQVENDITNGFTQVLENEKKLANGLARVSKQTEPFK